MVGGIDALAVRPHLHVQMRTGGEAGLPDRCEDLTGAQRVAFTNDEPVQMAVDRSPARAMVDLDHATPVLFLLIEIAGLDHPARRRRTNRRADRGGDILTRMKTRNVQPGQMAGPVMGGGASVQDHVAELRRRLQT